MHMAVEHASRSLTGKFLFEPQGPRSPPSTNTTSNAAACANFLRSYGLIDHVKLNLETNHATLPAIPCTTSWNMPACKGCWVRWTPTRGDLLLGWDTDQFPTIILPDHALHALDPENSAAWLRAASTSTTRVRAARVRAARPVLCAHRRHGTPLPAG